MTGGPRHVVVVGRDADLWLTATTLGEALGPIGVPVTAVELPSRLGPASCHATLPAIEPFHAKLGLDEAAVLRATRGSFTLGYNIVQPDRAPFLVGHGAYGAAIDGADFFPFWVKARRFGLGAELEDFSPTAMAARHGRILLPDEDTERFGRADYAYHLPAIAYAAILKSHARRLGVAMHQAVDVAVELSETGQSIKSVIVEGEPPIEADLFIDTSGPDAILIGQALGAGTEDWRAFFPFDRRLTATGERSNSVPTYAELRLSPRGATALYGSQRETYVRRAYRASDDEGDEAVIAAAAAVSGLSLTNVAITPIEPARRAQAWSGNCVAIGASACVFDPLLDLDLHAVQLGVVHLLTLFPTTTAADAERAEYNRIARSLFERLRDFQAALYLPFSASAAVPGSLQHKIDTFRARGAIAPMEDETFTADQWRALFVGLGLLPESWPPAIDSIAPDRMKNGFRQVLGFVRAKVLEQPTHDDYLADIGAEAS